MAILIDPFSNSIKQVETPAVVGLKEMYKLLDCNMIEFCPTRLDNEDALIVDEEGLMKNDQAFFKFDGQAYAGKGLILGTTEDGDLTSCRSDVDAITAKVTFPRHLHLVT